MKPEKIDNVNKPSHYQGSKGLESIEVIDNRTLIGLSRRWNMRIKTSNDSIINVDKLKELNLAQIVALWYLRTKTGQERSL